MHSPIRYVVSESQLFLLFLHPLALFLGFGSVLCLHLCSFSSKTLVDFLFNIVASAGRFMHEALAVAFFESCDDLFARWKATSEHTHNSTLSESRLPRAFLVCRWGCILLVLVAKRLVKKWCFNVDVKDPHSRMTRTWKSLGPLRWAWLPPPEQKVGKPAPQQSYNLNDSYDREYSEPISSFHRSKLNSSNYVWTATGYC